MSSRLLSASRGPIRTALLLCGLLSPLTVLAESDPGTDGKKSTASARSVTWPSGSSCLSSRSPMATQVSPTGPLQYAI